MTRTVKKYSNRKLYDTSASSYVSLKRIKEYIRDGETIEIIDNETGEDITSQTLTKAILDDEKNEDQALTSVLLHDLIRWGNKKLESGLNRIGESFNKVIPVASQDDVTTLQQQIKQLEEQVDRLTDTIDKKPAKAKRNSKQKIKTK